MVGRSWLNSSVAPSSSTTQLSLSISIIVLSKSKTTTILDIMLDRILENPMAGSRYGFVFVGMHIWVFIVKERKVKNKDAKGILLHEYCRVNLGRWCMSREWSNG